MAIARGAGTEIIRTVNYQNVTSSDRILIFGVQHHIYTILSIIINCQAVATASNYIKFYLKGYDSNNIVATNTQQDMEVFRQDMNATDTFVWNDKFSFNGHEPVDFTTPLSTIVEQDAIADQGSAVPQYLYCASEGVDNFDIFVTFIDQNNS
jgi:hypothetical protein